MKKTKTRSGEEVTLQAFPISLHHLKLLIDGLQRYPDFTKRYYSAVFIVMFMGCFRQNEIVDLINCNCQITTNEEGVERLTIRLIWHKSQQVDANQRSSIPTECVRHLYDEEYPLMPVTSYKFFLSFFIQCGHVRSPLGSVFPSFSYHTNGQVVISPFNKMATNTFGTILKDLSLNNVNLPKSITSHSFRRGGAIHRLWRADNRLDIDDLLAWCRWDDTDTAAVYLINAEMAYHIDPSDKLNPRYKVNRGIGN